MRYPDGMFGWVDIMTRNPQRAIDFYDALFGWKHETLPTPMGPPYTQFYKDGQLICGLSPMMPGVPEEIGAIWNSYVLVEDVDTVAARAEAAGGKVPMPPLDVMDQGRMAMITDPGGAAVGLWQPRIHDGADMFNEPGSLTWNELHTRDLTSALPFYRSVFGWEWVEDSRTGYQIANLPDKPGEDQANAGARRMPTSSPVEAPNLWMVYFAVEDVETAMGTAESLGGSTFLPVTRRTHGRYAGLLDPTGGMFMISAAK